MTVPFTRSLGARPGVQLNPIIDNTEIYSAGNDDQKFGVIGRFERGRIDKAFRVNRGNMARMLGKSVSPKVNPLGETYVQMYEAFRNGAVEAVVSRAHVAAAALSYMVVCDEAVAADALIVHANAAPAGETPVFAIKHLECFNDGVRLEVYARPENAGADPATWVKFRIKDVTSGAELFAYEGSLDSAAIDEFGVSTYLPNVVSSKTDDLEIVATAESVSITAAFYGAWIGEDLSYFTEGSTTYLSSDLDACIDELRYTEHGFGYLLAGVRNSAFITDKLVTLGYDLNKKVIHDLEGDTAAEAITALAALNIDTHYADAYWGPLLRDDPVNGGKAKIGTGGIQVGLRCRRNAVTDANGLAKKNYPVAGKDWAITATGIVQYNTPGDTELDDLAEARINPVLFTRYNAGSKYVFTDSLTGAKTNGDRKLIAVSEMATDIDNWVAGYGKECLQLPMLDSIKRMSDFLKALFEGAEAAKWIKPSEELDGRAWVAEVKPNAQRPNDRMDVAYWLHYDGTTRAVYVQQTLSK